MADIKSSGDLLASIAADLSDNNAGLISWLVVTRMEIGRLFLTLKLKQTMSLELVARLLLNLVLSFPTHQ